MTQKWWSYRQVLPYVAANYPCEFGSDAPWLVMKWIEDGTLPTWRETGLPVQPNEWRRNEDGRLEIETDVTPDSMRFDAAVVRRLCAPEDAPKNPGGRNPKYDYEGGLLYLASLIFNNAKFSSASEDDLFQEMRQWMRTKSTSSSEGGLPDDREIRKKVARFYQMVIVGQN
jgi:hypothetical protein